MELWSLKVSIANAFKYDKLSNIFFLYLSGLVSAIFFFKDPLSAHQHAADIEALTRICDVHNVPYATNSASGKSLVTSMAVMGLAFASDDDESNTVKEYKVEQQRVIQRISASPPAL